MQGKHTNNFCWGFYLRYTFCILSIYLSERVYFNSKMAQSNMHKTNLKLTVVPWMIQSSESSMLFNFKYAFYVWLLRLFDDELIGEILTKWHDLIQSFLFRLLATQECFIGKTCHADILPTDISSNWSKNLLISDGIIIKSEITNTWVILSSTNCSLLTKLIFKWVLTKPFCQKSWHIWHDVAEET